MKIAWTGAHPARRGMNRKIRETLQFYAIPAPGSTHQSPENRLVAYLRHARRPKSGRNRP